MLGGLKSNLVFSREILYFKVSIQFSLIRQVTMDKKVVVPMEKLSKESLDTLLAEYVSREGTDYGSREVSFQAKKEQVLAQLNSGFASIVFDLESESFTILAKEELNRIPPENGSI